MKNNFPLRIIARLDLKEEFLIKGIYFEGLKKIGKPENKSKLYFLQGIDEILCIDVMATLFNRKIDFKVLKKISKQVFLPITAGGGIKKLKT